MGETDEILPWQQAAWTALMERRRAGRLPHALLVTGPAGLGKNRFAEQFARALLCQQPTPDGACGHCRACGLLAAGSHPDYLQVGCEEDSKVIKIGQIRALTARLAMTSQLSGYRVVIITPAERMNTEAANSLLKTLEEPGSETLLLLVTTQPGLLPATVRSRCQRLAFAAPGHEQARRWLHTQAPEADADLLLALADGAPLAALELAQGDALQRRSALLDDLFALTTGQTDPVAVAERWHRDSLPQLLGWLTRAVMDLIRLKSAPRPPRLSNPDCQKRLQALAERVDLSVLYRRLDAVQRGAALARTQVTPQAILEELLIPWKIAAGGR